MGPFRLAWSAAVFALVSAHAVVAQTNARSVDVQTAQGALRGTEENGVVILRGVPFAAPPVGALRFKPPQPVSGWQGVRDATKTAPWCTQPETAFSGDTQAPRSEDCLYLNIWAPASPGPHPVFFWVHGGSNTAGSPSDPIFDGASFARRGIIVVDTAYRVGALGFLELGAMLGPDYRDSGNNGLRDVVAALTWVRDNIAAIGGDASRVTLAGESAGGRNVTSLLGAPSAKGLFQSAIIESGGEVLFTRQQAEAVANIAADAIARDGGSAAEILSMPPDRILKLHDEIEKGVDRRSPYRAVTGGDFLPVTPTAAIKAGALNKVRLLIGTNRDEMAVFTTPESASKPLAQTDMANIDLPTAKVIYDRYVQRYPDLSPYQLRVKFLTAQEYWVTNMRVALAHAKATKGKHTWVYRFDRESTSKMFAGLVPHASELPYIWGNIDDPFYTKVFGVKDTIDRRISDEMHDRWSAFVNGNLPNIDGGITWPLFDHKGKILIFDDPTTVGKLDSVQLSLWP